jgi:hypothetical protein
MNNLGFFGQLDFIDASILNPEKYLYQILNNP